MTDDELILRAIFAVLAKRDRTPAFDMNQKRELPWEGELPAAKAPAHPFEGKWVQQELVSRRQLADATLGLGLLRRRIHDRHCIFTCRASR